MCLIMEHARLLQENERLLSRVSELEIDLPHLECSGEIDINEVSSILIEKFPDVPLYLPDYHYQTCTLGDIKRFLEWDTTEREKYYQDAFDCDDFAWRLKGNITNKNWATIPFFVVWSDTHALNGFIDCKGDWYFVEPQTNEIQTELKQGTKIRFIGG